jgi:hypothetical protein
MVKQRNTSSDSDDSFSEVVEDTKPKVKKRVRITDVRNPIQNKKAKRPKNSNFVFTINTNVRIGPYEEGLEDFCRKLRDCMYDMFEHLDNYVDFLEPEHSWIKEHVKKAECESEVERGEKLDQIHCHVFIGVAHYSKIRLNRQAIRNKVCQDMALNNVYISKILVLQKSTNSDLEN